MLIDKHKLDSLENVMGTLDQGPLFNKSKYVLFKHMPARIPDFKYRNKDMCELLKNLIKNKERVVVILGLHGMGKSSLVKNAFHFIYMRK